MEEEAVVNQEVVQDELAIGDIAEDEMDKIDEIEAHNITDDNDNAVEEEAMENACHDLDIDTLRDEAADNTPESTERCYRSRSGRSVRRHNYNTINSNDLQMAQIKKNG